MGVGERKMMRHMTEMMPSFKSALNLRSIGFIAHHMAMI